MKPNMFLEKVMSKVTFYIIVITALLAIIIFLNPKLLLLCLCIFIFVISYAFLVNILKRSEIEKYIENLTFNIDAVTKDTLLNFQMPLVILELDGQVMWSNSNFDELFKNENITDKLSDIIKEFKQTNDSMNNKTLYNEIRIDEKIYDVYANIVRMNQKNKKENEHVLMMYFMDKTDYMKLIDVYDKSRLCIGIISIDNYEELIQTIKEEKRSQLNPVIGKMIRNWICKVDGMVIDKDRYKYIIAFEREHIKDFINQKFQIIEDVKKVDFGTKMPVTLSGGIIDSNETINEKYDSAFKALDVALGRGGDQIVLKQNDKYEFFGGNTVEVERITKVKSRVVAQALKEFIQTSKNVIIMGHKEADVDCIGSGLGLYRLVASLGKEAYILLDSSGDSLKNLLAKLENNPKYENVFINKNEALSKVTQDTLLIVVDTHKKDYVECPELLEETDNIIIIDHHRRATNIIENSVLTFHEVYASSTCELVSEIIQYTDEDIKLEQIEAESLYAGIMVDTKNFTLKSGVRTFEVAAYLRKQGADISSVNQMFKTDFDTYVLIADTIKNMEIVNNNIGIAMCSQTNKNPMLLAAQVADEMLYIENIQASFVITNTINNIVHISGRSLGNVNVQVILEKLGGGGHITMAGTQLSDISIEEAKEKLIQALNEAEVKI